MSREVRNVPADWQHPKYLIDGRCGPEERYIPLHSGDSYQLAVDDWDENRAAWDAGWRPERYTDVESSSITYEQVYGPRPEKGRYMPNWPKEQCTHLMMYETTSEGTPISPAFATPEELAQWLVETNASAFGRYHASYEGWLRVARGRNAPSMITSATGMKSGVDAV